MTQPQRTDGRPPARRRAWPHRLVAVALVLSGGGVTGWPVVETFANNTQGAHEVSAYVDAVAAAQASDPEPLHADVLRARSYNAALSRSALWDPWGDETPRNSPAHDDYLTHLATLDAMGRVRIPQIDVDLPILHDATKIPLSRGAGHLYGTSLPVGGADTHSVLAAHTGMKSRTMFDRLPEVDLDDTFFVDVHGSTLTYRVDRISVVEPWELEAVEREPGADLVTLVTCYTPPGEHKQRLLVRGVRVPDAVATASALTSRTAPVETDTSVQSWMLPRLAGAGGAVAIVGLMGLSWAVGDRRDARRDPARSVHPDAATTTTTTTADRREPVGAPR